MGTIWGQGLRGGKMKKAILGVGVLLALVAGLAIAETHFVLISATDTSSTTTFSTPRQSVLICNDGANPAFFRLFNEYDTPAAATAASSSIPVGACITFGKPQTSPAYYRWISVICGAGLTATVRVYSE